MTQLYQRHKSTTHPEKYFHTQFQDDPKFRGASVFARKEEDGWYAAVAFCSINDNFCRATGRTQARRKYFQKGQARPLGEGVPTAEDLENFAFMAADDLMVLV